MITNNSTICPDDDPRGDALAQMIRPDGSTNNNVTTGPSALDIIANDERPASLQNFLQTSGMAKELVEGASNQTTVTVLAPTNEAFETYMQVGDGKLYDDARGVLHLRNLL